MKSRVLFSSVGQDALAGNGALVENGPREQEMTRRNRSGRERQEKPALYGDKEEKS